MAEETNGKPKLKKREILDLHKQLRSQFEFDRLKMYFGDDYTTKNGIIVRQPTLGEIIEVGEKVFYETLNVFVANPTSFRLPLWQMDIDWCRLTDFELFCILYQNINPDVCKLFLPECKIYEYKVYSEQLDEDTSEVVLYNAETESIIRNIDYLEISQYLRTMFNIFPKIEYARGKATRESIIWEDEQKLSRNKNNGFTSSLQPLVSSCLNHPGFKYKKNELKEVGICEFMDSVNRLQVYENTVALLQGSMGGWVDSSKVPKENFNFMRDLLAEDDSKKYSGKEKEAFNNLVGKENKEN